jgi:hypothetical protein
VVLAIGLLFLRKRMNDYQTQVADPDDRTYEVPWDYGVIKSPWLRYLVVFVFFAVNALVVAMPFDPTKNSDGSKRHIPTWVLPTIVLPIYAAGALFAIYLLCIIPLKDLYFGQSGGRTPGDGFVNYNNRRWIIRYPEVDSMQDSWKFSSPLPWKDIQRRLKDNGEKRTAEELREEFRQRMDLLPEREMDVLHR